MPNMKPLICSALFACVLVGSVAAARAQTPAGADRVDRKNPGRQTTLVDAPQRSARRQYVRYYVPTGSTIPQVVRRSGHEAITSSPLYVIDNSDPLARTRGGDVTSTLANYSFITFNGRR